MTQHLNATNVRFGSAGLLDPELAVIRRELEQLRRLRTDQLAELAADTAEAVAHGDEPRRQVIKVIEVAAEAALRDIEDALLRVDEGTYGVCERCLDPIPAGRLEILPMTSLCISCQQRADAGRQRRGRG